MALSFKAYQSRVLSECAILGDLTETMDDLIKDALVDLILEVEPLTSVVLPVRAGVLEYRVPEEIDVVERVQTKSLRPTVFGVKTNNRVLVFQDGVDLADGPFLLWGTPREARANHKSIIDGLDDRYGNALWAFIRYRCYESVDSDKSEVLLQKAKAACHTLLQALNSTPGMSGQTIQTPDVTGRTIGDANALDGIEVSYSNLGEADFL
jgi:hypothetical protein